MRRGPMKKSKPWLALKVRIPPRDGSAGFSSERFIFSPETEWGQQRVSKLVLSFPVFPGQAVFRSEV